MCFSAEASFIAGAVLSIAGVAAIRRIRRPVQAPFAFIPLLFAVQQFAEGFVWLAEDGVIAASWKPHAALIFLIFAQVAWPLWVPWSIFLAERKTIRRTVLLALGLAGTALGPYHAYELSAYPFEVEISNCHIKYELYFQPFANASSSIYLFTTIGPPFVSQQKRMLLLGFAILAAFLVSVFFFRDYVISVWCFFAAIISVLVLLILRTQNKQV